MKKIICLFLIAVCLFSEQPASAQSEDISKTADKVQFKFGAFYNSRLNYYGRTDSLRSSGFFPLGELWFGKNLYINAAPVFINNAVSRFEYAGTVATAGYRAKSKNEKFLTHLFFTRPFYKSNSQLVQSALKEQLSGTLSWQNKYLNVTIGGDLKYGDKIDYSLNAGMDHIFRYDLPKQWSLLADPSAYAYAGTQQFAKTYYAKNGFLIFPGVQQEMTKQVNRLKILSYEFSAPVIFTHNNCQLILIPAYIIPENLIVTDNRPDLSERGNKIFYLTAGAKIIF